MNREETRKAAEVMLHYANGGDVLVRDCGYGGDWEVSANPLWSWDSFCYRIKPQPVVVKNWAVIVDGEHDMTHTTLATAESWAHARSQLRPGSTVRVVELSGSYTEE